MSNLVRYLAIAAIALGIAGLAIGIGFVVEARAKSDLLTESMRQEQITLGLTQRRVIRTDSRLCHGQAWHP